MPIWESLTVSTEVMQQKASAVETKIQVMKTAFDSLEQTVHRTENYWIGEAGDAHRDYFAENRPKLEEIIKRLTEHVRDLHQMKEVYAQAERGAEDLAEDLPSDVIV